jgi:hypothetical protein
VCCSVCAVLCAAARVAYVDFTSMCTSFRELRKGQARSVDAHACSSTKYRVYAKQSRESDRVKHMCI